MFNHKLQIGVGYCGCCWRIARADRLIFEIFISLSLRLHGAAFEVDGYSAGNFGQFVYFRGLKFLSTENSLKTVNVSSSNEVQNFSCYLYDLQIVIFLEPSRRMGYGDGLQISI